MADEKRKEKATQGIQKNPTRALPQTDRLPRPRSLPGTDLLRSAVDYNAVPSESKRRNPLKKPWRVVLTHPNPSLDAMGLEIFDDVVFGRSGGGRDDRPDLDLGHFEAHDLGVSRRHAMIRPSNNQLFLIDMGSMNGTMVNGVSQGAGMARALKHNDTLSLGRLHLTLKIMELPTSRRKNDQTGKSKNDQSDKPKKNDKS